MYKIIRTDSFCRDEIPDEALNLPSSNEREGLETIAKAINNTFSGPDAPHYWTVVDETYRLSKGMEDLL